MKTIIAGGGTGGHLFPAVALGEELKRERPDIDILHVGTVNGLEAVLRSEAVFALARPAAATSPSERTRCAEGADASPSLVPTPTIQPLFDAPTKTSRQRTDNGRRFLTDKRGTGATVLGAPTAGRGR